MYASQIEDGRPWSTRVTFAPALVVAWLCLIITLMVRQHLYIVSISGASPFLPVGFRLIAACAYARAEANFKVHPAVRARGFQRPTKGEREHPPSS
jgi:hypothetical protein